MAQAPTSATVLEPSAGAGVFVDAALDAGFTSVRAVEIDATLLV